MPRRLEDLQWTHRRREPQAAAFESAKATAKAEAKAKADRLAARAPSEPACLVGEKLDVHREGKWRGMKVLRLAGVAPADDAAGAVAGARA